MYKPIYRPRSTRNFKKFIGKLTATVAAIYISLCESKDADDKYEKKDGEPSYWSKTGERHGVVLSGVETSEIMKNQSNLSIVSLYSGFDAFCDEIKSEQKAFNIEWKKQDKVSPLTVLIDNANKKELLKKLSKSQKDCFEYYRYIRNSVAHASENDREKALDFYNSHTEELNAVRSLYNMKTAPNSPEDISFHDVKLFCRLLLDITLIIGDSFDPSDAKLANAAIFKEFVENSNHKGSISRQENAIVGFLKTEYGISNTRALSIKELLIH